MESFALISDCGKYRYVLTRAWNDTQPVLVFIMLNPSVADAYIDDATIRVCMGRARQMGYGGILVLNLFAYRATHPKDLLRDRDPVGADNDEWLDWMLAARPQMVIAAWGAHGIYRGRAAEVERVCRVHGVTLYCLGVTQEGQPKHPLRIAYSVEPTVWSGTGQQQAQGIDRSSGVPVLSRQ